MLLGMVLGARAAMALMVPRQAGAAKVAQKAEVTVI